MWTLRKEFSEETGHRLIKVTLKNYFLRCLAYGSMLKYFCQKSTPLEFENMLSNNAQPPATPQENSDAD